MKESTRPKILLPDQVDNLLRILKQRFETNRDRHPALDWDELVQRLRTNPDQLWALSELERTGGEPDVVGQDPKTGEVVFYDCAPESPAGRRSLCYDREALEARKKNKPDGSALERAAEIGAEILTEAQYRELQLLGEFDTKTSSWVKTPPEIRDLGGALFCDRRYNTVFVYHNGADSYYASRGFRCWLRV